MSVRLHLMSFMTLWVLAGLIRAQEPIGEDPFGDMDLPAVVAEYAEPVDRNRGCMVVDASQGEYVLGDHFAHWHWQVTPHRPGPYFLGLRYRSNRSKMGVQVEVSGLPVLKNYAPRTGGESDTVIVGIVNIPESRGYKVTLLTGGHSNELDFQVEGIELIPAPGGATLGQSIDGTINLEAQSATTYSEGMRYVPNKKDDGLKFWESSKDWAEWKFDVSSPGEFEVSVWQGCDKAHSGSQVKLLINDQTIRFKVKDTGGFQRRENVVVGRVTLSEVGEQKVAVLPINKVGSAVMDLQRVVLTPVVGL